MIAALCALAMGATSMKEPETIRLWAGDAPGALGKADKDIPTLTLYRPEKPCGTAIVVCPGGAYGALAEHEGRDYALWLNRYGVTAFVLKYRLGTSGYRHPVMLSDGARAIRLVRSRAKEWGVERVGIMGSSAGGHLASTVLTHFDKGRVEASDTVEQFSSRPDFGVLCYAVITMGKFTHTGSRENLLGPNADPKLIDTLSNERMVTSETPPCFIWHTVEDQAVPVENSLQFADALRKANVPFELHLYEKGGHGIGLAGPPMGDHLHPWTADLIHWLRDRGWVEK